MQSKTNPVDVVSESCLFHVYMYGNLFVYAGGENKSPCN